MSASAAEVKEVAYLVNLYPAVSHSFIRREIAALEAMGWRVHRFAHRHHAGALPDDADRAELARTTVLSSQRWTSVLRAVCSACWRHPSGAAAAWRLATQLSRGSVSPLWSHLGHWVLACVLAQQLRRLGQGLHVHAHFGTNPAAVALLLHRLQGQPYSLTCHGPHEFVRPDRLHLGTKMASAQFVAAVSQAGCEALRSRYPASAHKVVHVRCGLGAEWFDVPVTPVPDAPRLVCVARLDPQKDPLRLVAAAALLAQQGEVFELVVVGDGVLRDDMKAAVNRAGLQRHLRLLGAASQAVVQRELHSARALVLSSADEGLPVAIMEAFARGRPVIATAVGGVAELVETGVTGWLVPPADTAALAAAMAEALRADRAALQRCADRARSRVLCHDVRVSANILAAAWQGRHPPSGRL